MMKYVFWLFILVQWTFASTFVAVLETVSENGIIGRSEKLFLTDKLRERAKMVLPSNLWKSARHLRQPSFFLLPDS